MYSAQVLGALLHGALCIMEWAVMNAIPSWTGLVGRMRMGRLQFIFSIFSNARCPEKKDGNSYRRYLKASGEIDPDHGIFTRGLIHYSPLFGKLLVR